MFFQLSTFGRSFPGFFASDWQVAVDCAYSLLALLNLDYINLTCPELGRTEKIAWED